MVAAEEEKEKWHSYNIGMARVCGDDEFPVAQYYKIPGCKQRYLSEGRWCSGSQAGDASWSKKLLRKDLQLWEVQEMNPEKIRLTALLS